MADKTDETYAALQKAAAWFTTLQASDASGNDHARWERWMDAAPAHRTAWRKIEALNVAPARRTSGSRLLWVAGAVAAGALALMAFI